MAAVNTYLTFDGNTEEVFNFYKSVFGGEFLMFSRFKDAPGGDKMPPEEQDRVMHVTLPIGNGTLLMASDSMNSMGDKLVPGNNFSIAIGASSEEEAAHLFNGLSAGGTVTMPLDKTFWGAYFGMFTDKFGIKWMVNYDYPKQ
jgi:PhnB protein